MGLRLVAVQKKERDACVLKGRKEEGGWSVMVGLAAGERFWRRGKRGEEGRRQWILKAAAMELEVAWRETRDGQHGRRWRLLGWSGRLKVAPMADEGQQAVGAGRLRAGSGSCWAEEEQPAARAREEEAGGFGRWFSAGTAAAADDGVGGGAAAASREAGELDGGHGGRRPVAARRGRGRTGYGRWREARAAALGLEEDGGVAAGGSSSGSCGRRRLQTTAWLADARRRSGTSSGERR